MDSLKTQASIDSHFESWFVEGMKDFIRIPNLTTMVDPTYLSNGELEKCMDLVDSYINKLGVKGLSKQIFSLPDVQAPPLIVYTIEANESDKNIMVYGHLDKQPYGEGWDEDKPPTEPVMIEDRLYGRGGADDGYAPFSCVLAVKAIQDQGLPHPRIVLVLETEEESGSPHLIRLLTAAKHLIADIDVCICMDSGAMDYEQLWITSSLRGCALVDFNVQCGKDGYHSGEVGGIVPETFRIVRELLDRIDDSHTGKVAEKFQTVVPQWKQEEAEMIADMKGDELYSKYAMINEKVQHCTQEGLTEMYLNNVWRANLSVTGISGLPNQQTAGNVVRSNTGLRISMRLAPDMDSQQALDALIHTLTTDVPYNAQVNIQHSFAGNGWCMKQLSPALDASLKKAGGLFFGGKQTKSYGMGGSIPFLSELGKMYPKTQIVALGLLGPNANAHGPNEMLQLTFANKLTCSLAHVIQEI